MRVTHICIVHRLTPVDVGHVGVTAIDKRPVEGPIAVGRLGLWGDVQCDRCHHGGADKAVYAMSNEEMAHWEQETGQPIAPGAFGENLRVDGDVDDLIIGSRHRFGTALLTVTGSRTPCRTFEWWRGEEDWMKRFSDRGRTGVYFRVTQSGEAQAGDRLHQLSTPTHGVSAAEWSRRRPSAAAALAASHRRGEIALAPYIIKHMPTELRSTL